MFVDKRFADIIEISTGKYKNILSQNSLYVDILFPVIIYRYSKLEHILINVWDVFPSKICPGNRMIF